MATLLDRKALKSILTAANGLRKGDRRTAASTVAVYAVRPEKAGRKPTGPVVALNTLHGSAVRSFGGRVVREGADGLTAIFDEPLNAIKAGLHALHAADLTSEFLQVSGARITVVSGEAAVVDKPSVDVTGPAAKRVTKLAVRSALGQVTVEQGLFASLRASLEGHSDIEITVPRTDRVAGLGKVTTISVKPLGLRPDREEEWLAVDTELRARGPRPKALKR